MDDAAGLRIGDDERRAAVDALSAHREAGRLDPTEFEERQVAATRARTWAEIAPLFRDLPEPHPAGMPAGAALLPVPSPPEHPPATGPHTGHEAARRGGSADLVPARYRDTVMALTPMLAVVLFFVTRQWLWFLAIPIIAIVLYGPDGDPRGRKRRRRR